MVPAPAIRVVRRLRGGSPEGSVDGIRWLLTRFEDESPVSAEDILKLKEAVGALRRHGAGAEAIDNAAMLFLPEHYRRVAGLPAGISPVQSFIHFINGGARQGWAASPFFDDAFYLKAVSRLPVEGVRADESAFLHWLRIGIPQRIVPTPLFDEAYYLTIYPDIAENKLWGFHHFLKYGAIEGRRRNALPIVHLARDAFEKPLTKLPELYQVLFEEAPDGSRSRLLDRLTERQADFLNAPITASIFARAAAHEPLIGLPGEYPDSFFPPYSNPLRFYAEEIRRRLPSPHYDSVVCVPWVRMGGADLVSAHIAQSLRRLGPESRILVLLTETSHFERPEWFPADADVVDISDILKEPEDDEVEQLLYSTLVGVGARDVFNINSRQCWSVYRRFGRQLSEQMDLFGCLFCWDYTPSGSKSGYAAEYFAETIRHLKAVISDNDQFRLDLIDQYKLPASAAGKIVSFPMPTRAQIRTEAAAEAQVKARDSHARPMVLWAGRLDRQKRFDLVLQAAERMPHVDFHCWGSAVLDRPQDYSARPANIIMHPPFKSIEDLPLTKADVWLYTSAWDGMPNMVVELASAGMAVVASAVGGIPELIRPDTGWPVTETDSVEAYVAALEDAISHPDERAARARRLRELTISRHNEQAFDARLSALIQPERGS